MLACLTFQPAFIDSIDCIRDDMGMDVEHFKQVLLNKENDLLSQIAQLENEAHGSEGPDVGDLADEATVEVSRTLSNEEEAVLRKTLTQVQDALRRIEDGTYGKCVVCGREIDPARLEAIPWTPYCRADQEELDREGQESAR